MRCKHKGPRLQICNDFKKMLLRMCFHVYLENDMNQETLHSVIHEYKVDLLRFGKR